VGSFDEFARSLGEAIRRRRTERNWTLKQLAGRSGLAVGFLSAVETNHARASLETIHKICTAFEVSPAQLFLLAEKCIQFQRLEKDVLKTPKG
jgi:transcriptional regulator with XRE-family HTH domain